MGEVVADGELLVVALGDGEVVVGPAGELGVVVIPAEVVVATGDVVVPPPNGDEVDTPGVGEDGTGLADADVGLDVAPGGRTMARMRASYAARRAWI